MNINTLSKTYNTSSNSFNQFISQINLIFLILASITFLLFTAIPPTWAVDRAPSVNILALAYSGGTYNQTICEDIADKFDSLIMTNVACRTWAKARKPSLEIYAYTNITNCTAGDGLCNYLENRTNPDSYFIKASTEAIQDFSGISSTTPGAQTFTRHAGQRLCSYFASGWCAEGGIGTRWKTDYMTSTKRDVLVNYFRPDITPLPTNVDGYFFDNMERGCAYSGQLTSGSADNGLTAGNYLDKKDPMETACNALKSNMASNLSYKYLENYGNYMISNCASGSSIFWNNCSNQCNGITLSSSVAASACISKGIFQEFGYRFTNTFSGINNELGVIKEIWNAWGQPSERTYVAWWVGSVGATGIPGNSNRVKMFALGTQLLFQFQRLFMRYDAAGTNNAPATNDWFGAMSVPIGSATNNKSSVDSRTYKRNFANGIVLVRYRTSSSDNYTDSANYNLGGTYYPVNADGTFGAAVTSVTLANSESFIGVIDKNCTALAAPVVSVKSVIP